MVRNGEGLSGVVQVDDRWCRMVQCCGKYGIARNYEIVRNCEVQCEMVQDGMA